jgi:hypothetical protein
MAAHAISSSARSRQLGLVGRELSQHYGNKLFHSADEVKSANRRQGVAPDFGCWSYAAFNSRDGLVDEAWRLGLSRFGSVWVQA